jgi:hypothetical protein
VVAVTDDSSLAPAQALGTALHDAAVEICAGAVDGLATEEAATVLGLPDHLAAVYVERLKRPDEGLLVDGEVPRDALATLVGLRQRYLPHVVDGVEVLDGALDPTSGLVASSAVT